MAIDIRDITEKALEDQDLEFREGTPIHDIFAKAGQAIFDRLASEIDDLETQLFLTNAQDMDADEMDAAASNYFVERRSGTAATGTVRLLFSDPTTINIGEGERFYSSDGTPYVSTTQVSVGQSDMSTNTTGDLYYVDVPIASANDGEGNKEDIVYMEAQPDGLVGINTLKQPTGASPGESNTELKERIENQLGIRDLVREQSAKAQLNNNFSFIEEIETVGFRDPEMQRDVLGWLDEETKEYIENNCPNVDTVPDSIDGYHVGMHGDIFIKPASLEEGFTVLDLMAETVGGEPADMDVNSYDSNDNLITSSSNLDDAAYHIVDFKDQIFRDVPLSLTQACVIKNIAGSAVDTSSETFRQSIAEAESGNCTIELDTSPSNGSPATIQLKPKDNTEDLTYSVEGENKLKIVETNEGGTSNINKVLGLEYIYVPEIKIVQNFLDDEDNRLITSDLLCKHMIPVFIDVEMEYSGDIRPSELEDLIRQFIYFDTFNDISDIVGFAYQNGVDYVSLGEDGSGDQNLLVTKEVHTHTGNILKSQSGQINDKLKFQEENNIDGLSRRIQTLVPREIDIIRVDR